MEIEKITVCLDCQMQDNVFRQKIRSHDRLIHIAVQFELVLEKKNEDIRSFVFQSEKKTYLIVVNEYV